MFRHQMSFMGKRFLFDFSFVDKGMWTSFQFSEGNWFVLQISGKESWLLPHTMYLNSKNLKCKNKRTKFGLLFVYLDVKGSLPEQVGKPRGHGGDGHIETLGRWPSVHIRALGFAGGQGHAMGHSKKIPHW